MSEDLVAVFGGTGFLGRRVVQELVKAGRPVRVGARRPERPGIAGQARVEFVAVDIRDDQAVAQAVQGASAVVNAVSLYVEKGDLSFDAIHVKGAERVVRCAKAAGVERLVHVSGIGVSTDSPSAFVRARARGEQVVRKAFEQASIVRPSVMCDCGEGFLEALEKVAKLPVAPLFGRGDTRLQPAFVGDVAGAIAQLLQVSQRPGLLYELGGSRVYTYREAVQAVAAQLSRKGWLMPLPFSVWRPIVATLNLLPNPPLTSDQLTLMGSDNIVGSEAKTFMDLGIQPKSLQDVLDDCYPRS